MSEPSPIQKEDGYSPIAHPILEAMALAGLTASQYAVLLVVIRESYGWSRRDASLSLTTFGERTGMHRNTIQRAIASLVSEGVLEVRRTASFNAPAVYRLQKDPRRWGAHAVTPPSLASETVATELTGGPGKPPAEVLPPGVLHGEVTPTTEGDRGVTLGGNSPVTLGGNRYTDQDVAALEVTGPQNKGKQEKANTPTTTAREEVRGLDQLKEYLGQYAGAADRLAASAEHSPVWPASMVGLYGPGGTDELVWQRSPPEQRPALLAKALDRYAGEGKEYNGRYFRKFMETVIDEHQSQNHRGRTEGQNKRAPQGSWNHDAEDDYAHLG